MAVTAAFQRMGLRFASLETERQKREADEENEENGVFTFITVKTWPTRPTRRGNQHDGLVFTYLHELPDTTEMTTTYLFTQNSAMGRFQTYPSIEIVAK
jgi:hypothetical protein